MNKDNDTMESRGHGSEYVRIVAHISELWENAKAKAAIAVNTELIDTNWQAGQYIVGFEQDGKAKYDRKRTSCKLVGKNKRFHFRNSL